MQARRYFLTAFFIVIIFSVLSVVGDYLNVRFKLPHEKDNGFTDFISLKLIFVIPFLLTAWIPRIDLSLKLPLVRTIVWTLLLLPEFFHKPPMDAEVYLIIGLGNAGLCSLYQTFCGLILPHIHTYSYNRMMIEVLIVDILLFALFEVAVIKVADILSIAMLKRIDKNPSASG